MKGSMPAVIGNSLLRSRICDAILLGELPHAIILEGRRGTGKHTIAMMCAAALSCEAIDDPDAPIPCLDCLNCKKILEKKSPDVIVIGCEDKSSIGVDAIRFIKEDIRIIPNDLEYKVYIIEEADKMTPQAQNALLLSLEEPPRYVRFILLCESTDLLLETIRSRAPIYRTQPIDSQELEDYICKTDRRAAQMKLTDPQVFSELLISAQNGIGGAIELLDPKVFEPILDIRRLSLSFVEAAIGKRSANHPSPHLAIKAFSQKRDTFAEQLRCIMNIIRDLIVLKKSENAPLLFFYDRDYAIELCDSTSMSCLFKIKKAVEFADDENKRNSNLRLTVTKMFTTCSIL